MNVVFPTETLRNISHNIPTITELWMLSEAYGAGNCTLTFKATRFTCKEYWLDYHNVRYLVKTRQSGTNFEPEVIYDIKKYPVAAVIKTIKTTREY